MRQARLLVLGGAGAIVIGLDLLARVSFSHFDTGTRFTGWWFVLPALFSAALVIRPAWGSAVAGIAAGGVIAISTDSNMMTSFGVNWSVGDLFTFLGLVGTIALLVVRTVSILPNARNEFVSFVTRREVSLLVGEPEAPLPDVGS